MTRLRIFSFVLSLALLGLGTALAQERSADPQAAVVGTWDIEISADGQSYYLTMVLSEEGGQLSGLISEQGGLFSDLVLSSLTYDGETLAFEFTCPTPPDGMERLVQTQLSGSGETLEGYVNIPDLGVTAPAKAVKKS
jgi:hypothetical protein